MDAIDFLEFISLPDMERNRISKPRIPGISTNSGYL